MVAFRRAFEVDPHHPVVPLTFPAHQGPVLPLKMLRPNWFDATALVVGASSPDLIQGLVHVDAVKSHSVTGLFAFAVPFTIIYTTVLRRGAADGLFGSLPDMGPLRLHSYRVLSDHRPHPIVTTVSAVIGAGSHVFIDSFTHAGRWGTNLLGLNQRVDTPTGEHTIAKLLQYLGHSAGSVLAVAMFVWVARRFLPQWYSAESIAAARARPMAPDAGHRTSIVLAVSVLAGSIWSLQPDIAPVFSIGAFFTLGLLAAGVANKLVASRASHPLDVRNPATDQH